MKYTYLTFDCYGTLIDWKAGIEVELRAALGPVRLEGRKLLDAYIRAERVQEASYRRYREVLHDTVLSLSDALGVQVTDGAASRFADSVPRWPSFPDTQRFLKDMGSRGYKRFILSNVDNDLLEETVHRHRFEVDGFVTAEEVRSYKPDTGHWRRFMKKTGANKGSILHVAQSIYHDIIPTQGLGIASAWVNRYRERLPANASPSIIADSLAGLSAAIE